MTSRPEHLPLPAVVIVSYNTREPLRASIVAALREGASQIVVVDNASSDGSVAMVRGEFPGMTLLANSTNRGYGAAANQGIASCQTPYVLLLNGDAALAVGALGALAACLDTHPGFAIVGPRLVESDGSLQPSCYAFPGSLPWIIDNDILRPVNRRLPFIRQRLCRTWSHDRERVVPWIKGAAMAIRRQAFEAVGGFDESFPLFYEETDLCIRLHSAGWRTLFSPAAVVEHLGGASIGTRRAAISFQLFAGQVQYFRTHCPRLGGLWTILLKGLELPAQVGDYAHLMLVRDAAARAMLRDRLADRRRKIRLDPRRAAEVWRTTMGAEPTAPSGST